MFIRTLIAGGVVLALASPAFADCKDEITTLQTTVLAEQTGAAEGEGGMPATQHQKEVLSGEQGAEPSTEPGAVTGSTSAVSPHQQQVVREIPDEDRAKATDILSEAQVLAAAGDEQGCLQKVNDAKTALGIE